MINFDATTALNVAIDLIKAVHLDVLFGMMVILYGVKKVLGIFFPSHFGG